MEKYSQWRCPATGIQPFVPLRPSAQSIFSSAVNNVLVGPVLFVLRLPVLLFLVLALGFGILLTKVIPIRAIESLFYRLLIRSILFVAGFYTIPTYHISLKRLRKDPRSQRSTPDILICNSTSYIDILILLYKFNPRFLKTYEDGAVEEVSAWDLMQTCQLPATSPPSTSKRLPTLLKTKAVGPFVLFPEGTTSNGRGILKFIPIFEGFNDIHQIEKECGRDVQIGIIGVKYDINNFSPTLSVGTMWSHAAKLLVQLTNTASVHELSSKDINDALSSSLVQSQSLLPTSQLDGTLCTLLAQVLRLRKTTMGSKEKETFLDKWSEWNDGGYWKKSK